MMNLDGARGGDGFSSPDGWKSKKSRPKYEKPAGTFSEDDNEFPADWRVKQSRRNRMNGNDDPSQMEYSDDEEVNEDDDNNPNDPDLNNTPEKPDSKKGEKWKYWKDSPYEVSNMGRVRRGNKILKPRISSRGFAYLHASYNGSQTQPSYHSMVLDAFGPPPPKGVKSPVISHKDNNKLNNKVSNLKWASTSDNTQDAYSDGLIKGKGANNQKWKKENGKDGSKTGKKKD
jgi:hypothetical protein